MWRKKDGKMSYNRRSFEQKEEKNSLQAQEKRKCSRKCECYAQSPNAKRPNLEKKNRCKMQSE